MQTNGGIISNRRMKTRIRNMSPLRTPKISERECVGRFAYQQVIYQHVTNQQVINQEGIEQESIEQKSIDQRLNSLPAHSLRL
jgi:hypothetical protein